MTITNYPQLHHLGFKIICGWYMFNSLQYMNTSIQQKYKLQEQQREIIHLLKDAKKCE